MIRRGLTLVELLVAIFVAGIVAWLAFALVTSEHDNYTKVRAKVRLQGDAREAIRVIEEDLLNVGFRSGVSRASSSVNASLSNCPLDPKDRLVVWDGNGSDTLIARFFPVSAQNGAVCHDHPITLRYYIRNADSSLVREYTDAYDGATAPTPTTSVLLQHMVTLQVQVGTDTTADGTYDPNNTPWSRVDTCASCWTSSPALSLARTPLVNRATDTGLTIGGWNSAVPYSVTTRNPQALARNSVYRAGFFVVPNDSFRAMFDTAPGSTSYLRVFLSANGQILDSSSLKLPPFSAPSWVEWQFHTGSTVDYSSVYFGAKAYLSRIATAGPTLGISGLQVRRVRTTDYASGPYQWQNADSTNIRQRRATIAIRIWLLAKSARPNKEGGQPTYTGIGNWTSDFTPQDKNSYVVYERIIPVENYGY